MILDSEVEHGYIAYVRLMSKAGNRHCRLGGSKNDAPDS